MNKIRWIHTVAVSLLIGLGGCSERPQQKADVKVETAAAPKAQMPSGRAEAPLIDPEKKSVTVLMPPSAPQRIEQQQARLAADHERSEAAIHELMSRYAENPSGSATKARYEKQLEQELDAYKRRVLEMHKLQQHAARVADARPQPAAPVQ